MQQYLNQEFKDCVKSFQFKQGKTKEGTEYTYVSIVFINGYEHRLFLRGAEQFAIFSAFDQMMTTKQVDAGQTPSPF